MSIHRSYLTSIQGQFIKNLSNISSDFSLTFANCQDGKSKTFPCYLKMKLYSSEKKQWFRDRPYVQKSYLTKRFEMLDCT
jgi:hypothetical protein